MAEYNMVELTGKAVTRHRVKLLIILNSTNDIQNWESIALSFDSSWEIEFGQHYEHECIAKAYSADVIISSTPYVKQHLELLEEVKALNPAVLICIHPHEGFKSYTSLTEYVNDSLAGGKGSFRTSKSYRLESIDRYYFWGVVHVGEWATTLVANNGLRPSSVRCVGSVYNSYPYNHRNKDSGMLNDILYCSGCMTYGLYSDEDFVLSGDVLGGDGDQNRKVRIQHRLRDTAILDRRKIYSDLKDFASQNQEINITVRLHPSECEFIEEFRAGKRSSEGIRQLIYLLGDLDGLENISIEKDGLKLKDHRLTEFDCILHHGSTVALQAAYLGVPSICIKLDETTAYEQLLPAEERTYETLDMPGKTDIASSDLVRHGYIQDLLTGSEFNASFKVLRRYAESLFTPWEWYSRNNHRYSPLDAIAEDIKRHFRSEKAEERVYLQGSTLRYLGIWRRILKRSVRRMIRRY